MGISWHECFDANIIYSKNSLYFQNEASSAPEIKIFSKLDLLFPKSHLLFDLRLPKKLMITLEISELDIDLESDDLAQKDYFHNLVQQRRWHIFKAFFFEKWILWKSSTLKRFICFSLWIWQFDKRQNPLWWTREFGGRYFGTEGSNFPILEGVEDLMKASDAVRSLPFHSSFCSAHESLKIFSFLL